MDREPVWIGLELVEAIHARQIAEHGGPGGIRDRGMLESALARPQQRLAYGGGEVDLPVLAASYAYGIARNHPFADGNKRMAYLVCRLFLVLNGWDLVGPLVERYPVFLGMAAGKVGEDELTAWLREHARPNSVNEPASGYGK